MRLFDPQVYVAHTAGHAARYFIPVLGRYSAARLNELAQATVQDVRMVQGIACLCVTSNERGDTRAVQTVVLRTKRLKTKAGQRVLPLQVVLDVLSKAPGMPELPAWKEVVRAKRLHLRRFSVAAVAYDPDQCLCCGSAVADSAFTVTLTSTFSRLPPTPSTTSVTGTVSPGFSSCFRSISIR